VPVREGPVGKDRYKRRPPLSLTISLWERSKMTEFLVASYGENGDTPCSPTDSVDVSETNQLNVDVSDLAFTKAVTTTCN
jgi:hypothetical protein